MSREVKLLLLGAGESGKSTILKQLKVIHQSAYTTEECQQFREVIFGNIINGMQALLEGMTRYNISFEKPDLEAAAKQVSAIEDFGDETALPPDIAMLIMDLWSDPAVKNLFRDRAVHFVHIGDAIGYYLDNLERIADPGYVPTEQDIIRSRVKTTGIIEKRFEYKKMNFRVFDVGGQRSERKKWIHCFEDVTCVIFCVATSAFDESLIEDEQTNRLQESMVLFDSICNNKWFEETNVILFFNKIDLFKQKIESKPITVTFPSYDGPQEWEPSAEFIRAQFLALNRHSDRKNVYSHFTCATDTENIKFMFDCVTDVIIQQNLRAHQLI